VIKGIILDFDQTIVDSSKIEHLRDSRNWELIKSKYNNITLIPGIIFFFEFVKESNFLLTIVSNSPRRKYIEGILIYFDIKVDFVIGYEDTTLHKPNPMPMELALSKMGLNPDEVIAIGDSIKDSESAYKAGITNVYFNDTKEDLESKYFSVYSRNYIEIIEYIKKYVGEEK
jgi:HAD superfamily hydrolase (TIGR01662 family)